MKVVQSNTLAPLVSGDRYSLEVRDSRSVRVSVDGRAFADLRVGTGVGGPGGEEDVDQTLTGPVVSEDGASVVLTWTATSTRWRKKLYSFRCSGKEVVYHTSVEGSGKIGAVEYFEGLQTDRVSASFAHFSQFITSEVSMLDRRYYKAFEYACIDGGSGPTSDHPREPEDNNHWLFCPPPFAYAWSFVEGPWLGVGLAARPGEYNFSRFQHWPIFTCFKLRLTYDGMTEVSERWETPGIVLTPADDEYSAVRGCVNYLYDSGLCVRPTRDQPAWWSRPLFCGWGQQNMTAVARGGSGSSWARQDTYDGFLEMLSERDLNPGTIVIDDKWQKQYGTLEVDREKWPDMRGWIDARHAEGRKVLLWLGCWSPEGLPAEECIRRADTGDIICADPCSPAYEKRLREALHRMLSNEEGCLNADGLKVDWTNGAPIGEGYAAHGKLWGVELLKRLHTIVYEAAKQAKADSLIITHAANPYFAEVTDMLRLNDISAVQRDVLHIMRHRQKLALIADPDWLIDCDNSSAPSHDEWLAYTSAQEDLGVCSLYFLTGVDGTGEAIPMEDWQKLPDVWRKKGE